MKKNVAISVQDVGIRFNLNHERVDNLKEFVIKFLRKDLKLALILTDIKKTVIKK